MPFLPAELEALTHLLAKHGFAAQPPEPHSVTYVRQQQRLTLVHNPLEFTYTLWLGYSPTHRIELSSHLLRHFFHTPYDLPRTDRAAFPQAIVRFLQNEGHLLLEDPTSQLQQVLEAYVEAESAAYNLTLTQAQWLRKADAAWQQQQYQEVVNCLKHIPAELRSPALQLRYALALKKSRI